MTQTARMMLDERRNVAVHEAGHATIASVLRRVELRGVSIQTRTELPQLIGRTTFMSFDDASGILDTLMVVCGGIGAEMLVLGRASPLLNAAEDLAKIESLAVVLSGYHEAMGHWLWGSHLKDAEYIQDLFPLMSPIQQAITALAYQRAGWLLETHRTALDVVSGLLVTRDFLSAHEILRALALANA